MCPPPGHPQDGRGRQRGAEPRVQGSNLAAAISILARPSQGRDPAMLGRMRRSSGSSSPARSCARLDKKATSISLLVALGVREDGQKVLLAVKNMSGEHEAAWRALLSLGYPVRHFDINVVEWNPMDCLTLTPPPHEAARY
jgi:hypothetical protein